MTLDVPVAGMQGHANALECGLSLDALRLQVRALLPEPGRALSDDDNLIESGLDSLHVMRLVACLRRIGVAVTFSALIARPTLAAWWALVTPAMNAPVQREAPEPEPGEAAASFPLTDVQHAYWIGRRDDQPLGGIGCHAYLELDGRGVEPRRLEAAWRLLVRHHGMLRAVFDEDGAQRIDADAVPPMIAVHDLRQAGPDRLAEALDGIRGRLSHRRLRIEKGEVAGLELTLLPDGTTRIHFDLDLLVADVQSLQVILRDLAAAYARGAEPPVASNWSFARTLTREEKRKAATRDADRAYWHARLADVAGGPALPLARLPEEMKQPRFHRRIHRLAPPAWNELRRLECIAGNHLSCLQSPHVGAVVSRIFAGLAA
ncbi:MAG: hypothetical protein F8N37_00285 [Telmatospirillum sp.]|nr:hypothetical protein [Telmatospirillum sp.]